MRCPIRDLCAVVCVALCTWARVTYSSELNEREFFEARIRPVLVQYCYECHSSAIETPKGGLRVDYRDGLLQGGESGPAIAIGDPANSLLLAAVRHEQGEMPPGKKLPDAVIADLELWIRQGAIDPRKDPLSREVTVDAIRQRQQESQLQWWSWQPRTVPTVPRVRAGAWCRTAEDCFVMERLEANTLQPASEATRRVLARRVSFALTGLPLPVDTLQRFLRDTRPDAWERLVDQLLASPHFGEHWARHWMDVVRYTDTYGYEWDIPAKGAWRYRDYLIRALNADVSWDQMIREQLAGDLLESPRVDRFEQINESQIGPMFYQMGEKRHGDSAEFDGIHQEMLDNKIDALGKAFQATTIACARCHDHKLDPIAQREYYALAGVLFSSRWLTNTVDLPDRHASLRRELETLKTQLKSHLVPLWLNDVAFDLESRFVKWLNQPDRLAAAATSADPNVAKPSWDDPLYPWRALHQAVAAGASWESAWNELASSYMREHHERQQKNATHFTLVADFRDGIPPGWSVDGVGLAAITPRGDFRVALEGDRCIDDILHGGLCTHSLSPRMNGAVRTPWLRDMPEGHLSFELTGGDFSARRLVVDNAFLTEKQTYLQSNQLQWHFVAVPSELGQRHVYIEFATKTSNPNFPPRVGLGGACNEAQAADPRSWFQISRVMRHTAPFPPVDELTRWLDLLQGPVPTTRDQVVERYASWCRRSIAAWGQDLANDDQIEIVNWLLREQVLTNQCVALAKGATQGQSAVEAIVHHYREAESALPTPWTVNGMLDADPGFDYALNIRGEYARVGEPVARGYLPTMTSRCQRIDREDVLNRSRSGRLELADVIASRENPLTSRVFVNRVWHWLYGQGLVATPDDFGHAGELPSHPELLDHLAERFVQHDWSVKRLIREILISSTWRQSQATDARALVVDPTNRWLHHFPLRRLEAESIRDAILAVSGQLDLRLYGPPIDPHRAKEDPEKRLFSGPIDGLRRRSIYTKVTIMEPPRFLAAFNQPTPKIPTGRRDVTTTPTQSLTLLNDPFVVQQAAEWGQALAARADESPRERIETMFEQALGRPATTEEVAMWLTFSNQVEQMASESNASSRVGGDVWKELTHTLFNLKEFVYVR